MYLFDDIIFSTSMCKPPDTINSALIVVQEYTVQSKNLSEVFTTIKFLILTYFNVS